jgi:nuclear transport factor 2 (NTF2) superfamily protein
MSAESRPPFPPFTRETAMQKIRAAEDGWNSRDPERVALAYTADSVWRNRSEFFSGRRPSSSSCAASGRRSSTTG